MFVFDQNEGNSSCQVFLWQIILNYCFDLFTSAYLQFSLDSSEIPGFLYNDRFIFYIQLNWKIWLFSFMYKTIVFI